MTRKSGVMPSYAHTSAKIAYISGISFIVLLGLLHFLEPEYAPSWHFISEYELGSFGWLMQIAFVAIALSCISLGMSLWPQLRSIGGRIGIIFLYVSAVGMIIAAFFVTDPLNAAKITFHGQMHQLGPLFDSVPVASLLITFNILRKNPLWKPAKFSLWLCTLLVWAGIVLFAVSMVHYFPADHKFGPAQLLGWPNRIMISVQATWLIVTAKQAINNTKTILPVS